MIDGILGAERMVAHAIEPPGRPRAGG